MTSANDSDVQQTHQTMATKRVDGGRKSIVAVARHGERLDYVKRDRDRVNWVKTADQPWNPPLTDRGKEQGKALGRYLYNVLKERDLPPLGLSVYSSPLLRCRSTAAAAIEGYQEQESSSSSSEPTRRVRVEEGLIETINQDWYRSWALPSSDGTWGHRERDEHGNTIDPTKAELHPAAQSPIQDMVLDWKTTTENEDWMDYDYESTTRITTEHCWGLWETRPDLQERMARVLSTVAKPGECTLLLSHGGPVTFLFSHLTQQSWKVHGISSYACFSLYEQEEENGRWIPLVVNESRHVQDLK